MDDAKTIIVPPTEKHLQLTLPEEKTLTGGSHPDHQSVKLLPSGRDKIPQSQDQHSKLLLPIDPQAPNKAL